MARSLTLLFFLAVPAVGAAQGKLDQVREAVNRPAAATDSDSSSDDPVADAAGHVFGGVFAQILAAPWALPRADLDAGSKINVRFTPFPYADSLTRYVVLDRPPDGRPSYYDLPDSQWWSVRASAEAGSDFSGLNRLGLGLVLDTNTRFGLKSDWDWYTERLPCGCRDELWLGDLTATYRFVQNEGVMMTTGLGARFLLDDRGRDRGGFNFLYGFDAFPAKPVHVFGAFEGGAIPGAWVTRLRGGVGVNWTHAELFAGYDWVRIGGVNLHGPMAGLRLWF